MSGNASMDQRRKALITALILAAVAVGIYATVIVRYVVK